MDENGKTDGTTTMERLARELAECMLSCDISAAKWAEAHGIDCDDVLYTVIKYNARADIERRINKADLADDQARDRALDYWKAKAAELDALCLELGVDGPDNAADAVRDLVDEHCELKELREAGRIMPEGVSWPRYEDGEPVLIGDVLRGRGRGQGEYKAIGVSACGRMTVVGEDLEDDENLVLLDPDLMDRAPKAVGADGVEVKAGETVWLAREHLDKADMSPSDSGFECGLLGVGALDPLSVKSVGKKLDKDGFAFFTEHGAWCPASWLTHERPDSWGRLREDAVNDFTYYWGCHASPCLECPCKTGGKNPKERYGVGSCRSAMHLDLVARAERLAGVSADAR